MTGAVLIFSAPVLDDDITSPEVAAIPPLFSLNQLSDLDSWFCAKIGQFVCVPGNQEIRWDEGATVPQCHQTFSGHWLLGIDHWHKVLSSKYEDARRRLREQSAGGAHMV